MGKVLLVACTNVGRYMIERVIHSPSIKSELVGIVNLSPQSAISKANYDPYFDLITKYDIPVFYCENVNDYDCLQFIQSKNPDIIIQSGWSQKFKGELLSIPKYGCIGEHPAPLPKGRGAACVNWAILTGEKKWGDTFFKMVDEYDKGEIFAQSFFTIEEYDDVFSIYEKVALSASDTIENNLDDWSKGIFHSIEQNDSLATHYKKRTPSDGEIKSFNEDASVLHDFIRAQTHPYPGTFFYKGGKKIYILRSELTFEKTNSEPGTIHSIDNGAIFVSCKNGQLLKIIRMQEENNPSCWAQDYVKRNNIKINDFL